MSVFRAELRYCYYVQFSRRCIAPQHLRGLDSTGRGSFREQGEELARRFEAEDTFAAGLEESRRRIERLGLVPS